MAGTWYVGSNPAFVAYDSANGYVYVPNTGSGNVSVFANSRNATTVPVGTTPRVAAYNPLQYVYVTNSGSSTVSIFSGGLWGSYLSSVSVPSAPWGIVTDPYNDWSYVMDSGASKVSVLWDNGVYANISVGSDPYWGTFDAQNAYVYVSNSGSGTVSVLSGLSVVGTPITVGSDPLMPAYDSGNGYVYVPDAGSSAITVLNGTSVVKTITSGVKGQPQTATYDPWNGNVYVADYSGYVNVIRGTTVVASLSVGGTPQFATYNPGNGDIYVATEGGSQVSILNGTSFVANVSIGGGSDPHSVTYDPGDGDVFVANTVSSGTVALIGTSVSVAPCPSATMIEGGPTGKFWYVQVQNGFEQAWVNWTDPTGSSTTFEWGSAAGFGTNYTLPVPKMGNYSYGYSMNLSALSSSTTYQFTILVGSGCGTGATVGSFSTWAPPAGEMVGWVHNMTSNSHELDQIGAPIPGATIDSIWADCVNPNGRNLLIPFATGATTASNGSYAILFPLTWSLGGYTYYDLWNNGTCKDNTFPQNIGWIDNPRLNLNASATGYWNATEYVDTAPSNGYHQFGLPHNEQVFTIPGIAFVHSQYSSCGVTIATTISQTISSYDGGTGTTDMTSWRTGASAPPVSNGESEVDFHQYTTGVVNESLGPAYGEAYAFGNMFDPSQNAVNVLDPETAPSPGQTYPIPGYPGYMVETVGPNGGSLYLSNGGSYTSTSGLNITVSLTGGWDGVSFGVAIPLSYTTTTGVSSQTEIICSFTDAGEPRGDNAQFYYNVDGSQASKQEAINIHVWFDDYCVPNNSTCSSSVTGAQRTQGLVDPDWDKRAQRPQILDGGPIQPAAQAQKANRRAVPLDYDGSASPLRAHPRSWLGPGAALGV